MINKEIIIFGNFGTKFSVNADNDWLQAVRNTVDFCRHMRSSLEKLFHSPTEPQLTQDLLYSS